MTHIPMSPQTTAISPTISRGMTGELGHGEGGADVPLLLVDAGGLPGQKQDKGDLDDLVGLEIQGEVGMIRSRASQFRLPPDSFPRGSGAGE